jgi:hypothetical protein
MYVYVCVCMFVVDTDVKWLKEIVKITLHEAQHDTHIFGVCFIYIYISKC